MDFWIEAKTLYAVTGTENSKAATSLKDFAYKRIIGWGAIPEKDDGLIYPWVIDEINTLWPLDKGIFAIIDHLPSGATPWRWNTHPEEVSDLFYALFKASLNPAPTNNDIGENEELFLKIYDRIYSERKWVCYENTLHYLEGDRWQKTDDDGHCQKIKTFFPDLPQGYASLMLKWFKMACFISKNEAIELGIENHDQD